MADIVIRGLEMPKENEILVFDMWHGKVYARSTANIGTRRYEVVPLPEGHGRLGDLDALEAKFREEALEHTLIGDLNRMTLGVGEVIDRIRMADTIVPAEGGTDECSEN